MKSAVWARRLPCSIVASAVLLVLLGWAGAARCDDFREALSGQRSHFLQRQVVYGLVALAAMIAVSLPNYRILCRAAYALFLSSLVLLVVVYFFPEVNNARRWIRLGPLSIQPSEFAKVAYILALARYLMYRENYRRLPGLVAPLAITLVPVLLILKEPDLGTATVFLPVLFVMLFAAGAQRKHLAQIAAIGLVLLPVLWTQMSREQRSRVTALFDQPAVGERPGDDAYHLYQAKRMLALGGTWGSLATGPAVDDPAAYRLPEAHSDFIFCVLGERFGLIGLALVLVLYGVIAWRGLAIAAATQEPFGRLVATGLCALLAIEVLVNTGMSVGLLPITGLSLPMVSAGGSGIVAHGLALGLLLNVGLRPGYEVTAEPFRWIAE